MRHLHHLDGGHRHADIFADRDEVELARFCFIGGGGSAPAATTTQTNDIPEFLKPDYAAGLDASRANILNRTTSFFPGRTFAERTPLELRGLNAISSRASAGSPLLSDAQGYTGDVLQGDYLSPESNPFLAQVSDSVLSQVQPQVDSTFARAGRTGASPLAAEALGRGVSRGMAPYLFGEYGRERGIQEQAASRAPGLAREDYFDPQQMLGVGAADRAEGQRYIDESMARFGFAENEPAQRALSYMGALQGVPASLNTTRTQTGGRGGSSLLTGLGAAGTGAGIGSTFGPWGTAIGAGAGGLVGLSGK